MTLSTTSEPNQDAIGALLGHCHKRDCPNRTVIIRPGDTADSIYYILSGSATVSMEDDEGHELILGYLSKGDFVGEMGLFITPQKRHVLVRAKEASKIAEISYSRLNTLLNTALATHKADILYAIGLQLTSRLLNTRRQARRLAFLDVTDRIARTLMDLSQAPDAMTHPEGMQISISRKELSLNVGCSREMAGRVLKRLEEDGMIKVSGKTIVVLKDDRLV